MTANNLLRTEATERARLLKVHSYQIDLDLVGSETTFESTTVVAFRCTEPGAETFIELTAPSVSEIVLNGRAIDPTTAFDGNRITLTDLAADNELRVVADCAYSKTGEGLHRFIDRVDKAVYVYSQFESYDAHRVYACFDQPDLKAVFKFRITAPAHWTVVSNAEISAAPEPGAEGRGHWEFAPTKRMSTYITAVIAGPYYEVRSEHDGIDLGVFCRASLAEFLDPDEIFLVTKQGFDFFHANFDFRYPFGKYDQLFVPEFNAGAMENAGAVTFLEDYVFRSKVTDAKYERRAETILHELAHMWFGNLVTMRWWDDLWLNESFATYASVLCQVSATRWDNAWTTFCNAEKTWAYRQDQLPSTHPIAADAPDIETVKVNFDGITYAKGASVLKQLVAWVGQEEFLAGLRTYFVRHAWGNTSLTDLLTCLEQASGRNLSQWSGEWLETMGVNTLRPQFTVDDDGAFATFSVLQEAAPEHPTMRSHRVAIGLYDVVDHVLVRRDRVELDVVGAQTEVPKLVGLTQPDLILLNDGDLTFTKIRLDPRSLATVTERIGTIGDSLARTLCWNAAWDMTRDAEMRARDFLRLVLAGIGAETDIGVVSSLLAKVAVATWQFGDPANVDAGMATLASRTYEFLLAAEPGSDFQLAYAQAFTGAATSVEHLAFLTGLLDGSVSLAGLAVDTELRWTLLTRLVVLGRAGDAQIAAELDRDATASGEKRAMAARASRPTAEAKAEAWTAVVDSDELSNHLMAAAIAGFWVPEQLELVEPYFERYFASIARVWETRSMDVAHSITEGLYPGLLIDERTVRRTDAYLAEENPQPALRRLLMEARDGVSRALRARAFDSA